MIPNVLTARTREVCDVRDMFMSLTWSFHYKEIYQNWTVQCKYTQFYCQKISKLNLGEETIMNWMRSKIWYLNICEWGHSKGYMEIYKDLFYFYVSSFTCWYMHMSAAALEDRGVRSHRAWVTGCWEPPEMGAQNNPLCKGSRHACPLKTLSSPESYTLNAHFRKEEKSELMR